MNKTYKKTIDVIRVDLIDSFYIIMIPRKNNPDDGKYWCKWYLLREGYRYILPMCFVPFESEEDAIRDAYEIGSGYIPDWIEGYNLVEKPRR